MVNLSQGQRHAGMTVLIIFRCISCGNVAIIIVLSFTRAVAAADYHEPFISHFSVRRNLTTAIVFDELVVKGEQAAIRGAVCVITCCAVTLISSNSNDTASATCSAEAIASLPWLHG